MSVSFETTADRSHPIDLHPIDQHVLEQTGDLPGLQLLVNPEVLKKLRSPVSLLDTIETSARKSPSLYERSTTPRAFDLIPPSELRHDYTFRGFLLKNKIPHYKRALEIYDEVGGRHDNKFVKRLKQCRAFAWFVQSEQTGKLRVQSSRCKLRWCPICRDVSRHIVTLAVQGWLEKQRYPKMLTLTLKHSDDPLQLQVKRIYDCFRKLRQRALFKRLVTGGVWFFQLTYNNNDQQWHPHIHCLIAGKFLPRGEIKKLWHKITGDSTIIDIRRVRDLEACAQEVARYATSPADITTLTLDNSLDVYYATKSKRITGSWGNARSIVLKPKREDDDETWNKVADFYYINTRKDFDPQAKTFWDCYRNDAPYQGPQLQLLSEVFAEELAVARDADSENLSYRDWMRRILHTRADTWRKFFDAEK